MEWTRGTVRGGRFCIAWAVGLLVLWSAWPPAGRAQGVRPETLFTAEGVGVVSRGNQAQARDRAIVSGLRGCVEQAVVDLVEPELILANYPLISQEVLDKSEGYVRSYRIFYEEPVPDEDLYRVAVQSTVALSLLKSDLQAMGLYAERRGKPTVMVLIEEVAAPNGAQPPRGNPSLRAVVEHFRGRGFPVVDSTGLDGEAQTAQALAGNSQAAASLARKAGAQVVIVGKTVLRRIVPSAGGSQASYQATISVRAVDAAAGRIVAVGSESAVALPGEGSDSQGVIREAASKVAAFVADQLLIQWKVEETASNTVTLAMDKISVADLSRLKAGLKSGVPGVRRLLQRRYGPEGALVEVDYAGEAAQLADALSQASFGLFQLQVVSVGPQRIDLQVLK